MPRLTGITVRAASRQPIGRVGFQEAAVALSFAVADGDPALDGLADHVSAELEAAFARLWARLDGAPEPKPARAQATQAGGSRRNGGGHG
jgi:hypothetical protein